MSALLAQASPEVAGSSAEFWVFVIIAPLSLGTGLAVVMLRNAIHAALMLVLNFFTIAVLFAVLEAQFLAVVQIIVYAGAIMVLFLFVLMLLGITTGPTFTDRIRGQRTVAILLGAVLVIVLVAASAGALLGPDAVCPDGGQGARCAGLAAENADGNVVAVGRLLFTNYVWPFEVTSVLLVIAALGAIVLGKHRRKETDVTDRESREIIEPADEEAQKELEPSQGARAEVHK